ncbi:MAG: hypothetical protein K2H60_06435 [Muribaculaceae bacterium]|nr:hypothetical protein [Muribaculaceae bacterium]
MKNKYTLLRLMVGVCLLLLYSCKKDEPLDSIECRITYDISATDFTEGDQLIVDNLKIIPTNPISGVTIKKVEYYLGNKLIESSTVPPYKLVYSIPSLPIGSHLLQIDIHLSAEGYANTIVWLKQNINIYEI